MPVEFLITCKRDNRGNSKNDIVHRIFLARAPDGDVPHIRELMM
jgi:hypothetical protein